jgi:hypothetical protein
MEPTPLALMEEIRALRVEVTRLAGELEARCANLTEQIAAARGAAAPRPAPTALAAPALRFGAVSLIGTIDSIEVRSSDPDVDPCCRAWNVVSPLPCVFCTEDLPGQWVSVRFVGASVVVDGYTLRSINAVGGSVHPRGWVLEGSEDGTEWIELDARRDTTELNGPNRSVSFAVRLEARLSEFRLTQTQPNHCGNDVFALAHFDLLGRRFREEAEAPWAGPPGGHGEFEQDGSDLDATDDDSDGYD